MNEIYSELPRDTADRMLGQAWEQLMKEIIKGILSRPLPGTGRKP